MPTAYHLAQTRIRLSRGIAAELAALDRHNRLPLHERPSIIAADWVALVREIGIDPNTAARCASARALAILSREARA